MIINNREQIKLAKKDLASATKSEENHSNATDAETRPSLIMNKTNSRECNQLDEREGKEHRKGKGV